MADESESPDVSLGEQAYRRLRDLILFGELQPGERVTERAIHSRLGLGASPIRDALARLDVEGLIITLPRRGYQISPLTLQGIEDLFDVWRIIGPAMVGIAFRQLGADGMARLHTSIADSITPLDTPVEAARRAWTAIARATANPHLIDTFARLELHLARVLYLTVEHLAKIPGPGLGHHTSVMDSLVLADDEAMQRKTAEFIEEFRDEVLTVIRQHASVRAVELNFRAS